MRNGDRIARSSGATEGLAESSRSRKGVAKHFGDITQIPNSHLGRGQKFRPMGAFLLWRWADWILIAEVDGRIAGYSVWKKASELEVKHSFDIDHCNLAGIHPDFFGQDFIRRLLSRECE